MRGRIGCVKVCGFQWVLLIFLNLVSRGENWTFNPEQKLFAPDMFFLDPR